MKAAIPTLVLIGVLFLPHPATAQEAQGRWAVAGMVDGKSFTLDCRFEKNGEQLTGSCIDGPTGDATVPGGRSHPLVEGRVSGDNITWSYESSYLLFDFRVKYSGTLRDKHIAGTIVAAGKTGNFTADRVNP